MDIGDPTTTERTPRSRLDQLVDTLNDIYAELLETLESGGLDQLSDAETVAVWQRAEAFRNRLPLVDHRLVAYGEATDLAKAYCSSTMTQLLVRVLQLSSGEAVSRVRPPRRSGPAPRRWANSCRRCCRSWQPCSARVW